MLAHVACKTLKAKFPMPPEIHGAAGRPSACFPVEVIKKGSKTGRVFKNSKGHASAVLRQPLLDWHHTQWHFGTLRAHASSPPRPPPPARPSTR
jgi:hypothetical protein